MLNSNDGILLPSEENCVTHEGRQDMLLDDFALGVVLPVIDWTISSIVVVLFGVTLSLMLLFSQDLELGERTFLEDVLPTELYRSLSSSRYSSSNDNDNDDNAVSSSN